MLEFNQSQWLKPYFQFNTQKRIEVEETGDKDNKALDKLMNIAAYGITMRKVTNKADVRLINKKSI